MENQTVGLKTLIIKESITSFPHRPQKKRVFTDEEWAFLNSRTNEDLYGRIEQGNRLIELLGSPQILNMVKGEANYLSSNLRYQQDAIGSILIGRGIEL